MLVLIEKGLHTKPLDEGLKNYIKGIIFNISTTIYNENSKYTDFSIPDIPETETELENLEYEIQLNQMYSVIKSYVYDKYYKTGKGLNRWRILYLRMKGYSYDEICNRLGIQYYSAIQLYYLCKKELKDNIPQIEIDN